MATALFCKPGAAWVYGQFWKACAPDVYSSSTTAGPLTISAQLFTMEKNAARDLSRIFRGETD
jgi:hypothetical protein